MTDPELRIGDAEREAAVASLGEHYAAGRLTREEYDERSALALAARSRSALAPLFADLPRPESAATPVGASPHRNRPQHAPRRRHRHVGFALLPVLLVALVVGVLVGHPVFLLVLLGLLVLRLTHGWDHRARR